MESNLKIPNHIAIILDGNGRWAKKRGLPRTMGHRQGAINLKDITLECQTQGIKYLTVFCFSTENWKRPEEEVSYLMNAPYENYYKYKDKIIKSNIRIKVIGRRDRLNNNMLNVIKDVEQNTSSNTGLTLTLCIDYGSQDEITTAVKEIAKKVLDGSINIDDINDDLITNTLFTKDLPQLDLLIRTSGELRISNYLLWQLAYSELYFTDVYWPDFNALELLKAIESYSNRKRRFGGLNANQ
jgi:undecaprenyl diphosphate synthase